MKKTYDSTIEEAVHVHFRLAEIAGALANPKRHILLCIPIIFLASWLVWPGSPLGRLCFAGCLTAGMSLVYLLTYKFTYGPQVRRHYRKLLIKARGTEAPVPTEYEIDETGLILRQMGQELRFSWDNVQVVNATENSVEVVMHPTAIAIIPNRIFEDHAEVQEWIAYIEQRMGDKG